MRAKKNSRLTASLILEFGFCFLGAAGLSFSQTMGTGTITGTVADTSGAVIPGVRVTVTRLETGLSESALTGSSGSYSFPQLPVGHYEIRAAHSGFKAFEQKGVVLNTDSAVAVNIRLEVGPVTQSVTVEARPPAIQSQTGEVSTLVSGEQVSELGLNGRNFTQYLTLGTGVNSSQAGLRMGVGQEGNSLMSVNGGRINSTEFTYDGVLAMDTGGNRGLNLFPPMDALAEVEIKKSNFSADSSSYGYGLVNVVTKSGGREFHGDVYETLGNAALDARNFFENQRGPFIQNIFGLTLGGPFTIPGHYNPKKDKTFFFFSEGWNKRHGPQLVSFTSPPQSTFTATTPDSLMSSGNFTGVSKPIIDPNTGKPFPGNMIDSGRIDSNARLLLQKFYPPPDRAGQPNFVFTSNALSRWREELARVDQNISDRVAFTVRFAHDAWSEDQSISKPSPSVFPTVPGFFGKPGWNVVARLQTVINPGTINAFIVGFSRNAITQIPQAPRTGLNIPKVFSANFYNAIPDINLAQGFGSIGIGGPTNNVNNIYTFRDDLTQVRGDHSLKFGLQILRLQKFDFAGGNDHGAFTFNGSVTGNAVADFLLGTAFQYTEDSGQPNGYFYSTAYEFYGQDDWKLKPNLTLNAGLRWTIFAGSPIGYDKFGKESSFDPSLFNRSAAPSLLPDGELVAGTGDPLNGIFTVANKKGVPVGDSLLQTRSMPAPRLGFAWQPWGSQRTVLRGGYGIFYHWDNNNQENLRANPPFTSSVSIFNTSLSNPAGGTNRVFPPSLQAIDWHILYPNVQQWSFGIQHEFPAQVVLSVEYVGNHAVHLDQTINVNQPRPNLAVAQGKVNVNTVRPFPGFGGITFDERSASADYNGLQVDVRRHFQSGLGLEAAYTYSKSLQWQAGQNAPLDKSEEALSNLDRIHNLTINWVYEFPFYRDQRGLAGRLLGGWEWSGIAYFESGFPFTVTQPSDRAGVGGGSQRPDLVGAPTRFGRIDEFFDTSAFAQTPLGRFGTAGADIIKGPGISDDYSMNFFKNTRIAWMAGERANLQVGAEVFNIFNHANFNGVGSAFGSSTFGHITSALDPREIQFRVKIMF